MDLIVSGMALSYQWWPSLVQYEESLPGKRKTSPALVEQAGEVIYQAVQDATAAPDTSLTIIYDLDLVELGQYLPTLQKEFISIKQVSSDPSGLLADLQTAGDAIQKDRNHMVAICEITAFGSAAIVLSSSEHRGSRRVKLRLPESPGLVPSRADYAVVSDGSAVNQSNTAELLTHLYQDRDPNLPVAIGSSIASRTIYSELLSLIHCVVSIEQKIIPASGSSLDPLNTGLTSDSLYVIHQYRPWFTRRKTFVRSALLIFSSSLIKGPAFLVLEEIVKHKLQPALRTVHGSDPYLFVISGNSEKALIDNVNSLKEQSTGRLPLKTLANNIYTQLYSANDEYVVSLLAADRDQLSKEIQGARSGIKTAFRSGTDWKSPNGSHFTINPLGSSKIAFVYPGAFNSYPGMGKELFFSFPGLYESSERVIPDLGHSLAEDFAYVRPSRSDPQDPENQIMEDFYQHPNRLIESGISLSVLQTLIMKNVFGIQPDVSLGYSLGEISMLWANQIWQNAEESSNSWKRSRLFKENLVGQMKTVRDYWPELDLEDGFWSSFILKTDHHKAKEACNREPMAFLSIENTPNEVVIVGEKQSCQRVIDNLQCRSLPMPFNAVIHNPTMESCLPDFTDLYNNPTNPRSDMEFYSAADYQKIDLDRENLARTMAKMTCNPVDFPRLIEKVYFDGARIFIEIGPQKTCSRWIDKILVSKPHAAISVNKKFQPDLQGFLKVIALLLSHKVDLDLSSLFPGKEAIPNPARKQIPASETIPQFDRGQTPGPENISDKLAQVYLENLERVSADLAQSHSGYLEQQQIITRNMARMMHIQAGNPQTDPFSKLDSSPLYSKAQIAAFTAGDHRICFGDTFSGFEDRRIPRLPNGDLQFIDRVLRIDGQSEEIIAGSTLESEYDLPDTAWFKNGSLNLLPHVAIMEMALQPCGFLSAYMGTIKGRESQDLYFRNLDGQGILLSWPENPGRTIRNRVKLISSSSLENVIIQEYNFELTWGGQAFYRGSSSFGYFPESMLVNQSGLDIGPTKRPWQNENPESGKWQKAGSLIQEKSPGDLAGLPEIDNAWISPKGGKYASGYIYTRHQLNADAWFYKAHFYQDPVMPGSLGVETMVRALTSKLSAWNIPENKKWRIKPTETTSWKYRGQITPDILTFEIELHIKKISQTANGWEICADGILWRESLPIYAVEGLYLETY